MTISRAKRMAMATVSLIALIASAQAAAADGRSRRVEEPYGALIIGSNYIAISIGGGERFEFRTRTSERYVSIELDDLSGTPVGATVGQDRNRDTVMDPGSVHICGATEKPLPIKGGAPVLVDLDFFQPDCNGRPAIETNGTLIATFRS